jgi:type III restriction enzyme
MLFRQPLYYDEFFQEATIWIDGLDKVQKLRGINVCIDQLAARSR